MPHKTAKDVLEALWEYMGDNGRFGAWDTEPKFDVRDVFRSFEPVPETSAGRWALFSSMTGVGAVNLRIAKFVNRAIKLTKEQGFGGEALVELWSKVAGIDYY